MKLVWRHSNLHLSLSPPTWPAINHTVVLITWYITINDYCLLQMQLTTNAGFYQHAFMPGLHDDMRIILRSQSFLDMQDKNIFKFINVTHLYGRCQSWCSPLTNIIIKLLSLEEGSVKCKTNSFNSNKYSDLKSKLDYYMLLFVCKL